MMFSSLIVESMFGNDSFIGQVLKKYDRLLIKGVIGD